MNFLRHLLNTNSNKVYTENYIKNIEKSVILAKNTIQFRLISKEVFEEFNNTLLNDHNNIISTSVKLEYRSLFLNFVNSEIKKLDSMFAKLVKSFNESINNEKENLNNILLLAESSIYDHHSFTENMSFVFEDIKEIYLEILFDHLVDIKVSSREIINEMN